jgi:hypothetical protein
MRTPLRACRCENQEDQPDQEHDKLRNPSGPRICCGKPIEPGWLRETISRQSASAMCPEKKEHERYDQQQRIQHIRIGEFHF